MGRNQKLLDGTSKVRKLDSTTVHGKRLKAINTAIASSLANGRGGDISRDSVTAHALVTFGSPEKAQHWMNRPNPLFGGKTAVQVMESDPVGVEAELVRIDHGVYM
jgi:uncharacterized protein (DUF2384 family)